MENLNQYHFAANNYEIRTETYQDKKHIVVPVVMMVEGVHNGSAGPLLHSEEELSRAPHLWNGRPVTVPHPQVDGVPASANLPETSEQYTVGTIFNAEFVDGKLKAEAWIDIERLRQYSVEALGYIRQARPLDVSVGVFTEDELTSGDWNGEHYEGIARNHAPDHLALLPGAQGACSWADGCGIRANSQGGEPTIDEIKQIKQLAGQGYQVSLTLKANEQGFRDIMQQIQGKLDAMDDDVKLHWLVDTFDDSFVYEVGRMDGGDIGLFRRDYSLNAEGTVEFDGEPEAVVKRVEFVALSEGGDTSMAEPCCKEKVEMVIQMDHVAFDEGDRDYLLTLKEDRIDALLAIPEPTIVADPDPAQINADQIRPVIAEHFSDPEEALKLLPTEMQEQLRSGLVLHRARRAEIVTHITTQKPDVYTAEELQAMPMEALEKIGTLLEVPAPAPVDYSVNGAGGAIVTNIDSVGKLMPAGAIPKQTAA